MKKIIITSLLALAATCIFVGCSGNGNDSSGQQSSGTENVVVTAPTSVASKVYTGETLTADVEESEYYTVYNEGGIEVGSYDVIYKLKSGYTWSTGEKQPIVLTFEITQAANAWLQSPTDQSFTYGNVNTSFISAQFGDVKYEWYVDGVKLSQAPTAVGEYTVKISVAETKNYAGLDECALNYSIKKAENVWVVAPVETNVEYGNEYDLGCSALYGDVVYEWYDASNNRLDAQPTSVGVYNVICKVAETENYQSLTAEPVEVTITKAENAWKISPTIFDIEVGDEFKYLAEAKIGDIQFEYYDANDEMVAECPTTPGKYSVVILVAETENYTGLRSEKLPFDIGYRFIDLSQTVACEISLADNKHYDFEEIINSGVNKISLDGGETYQDYTADFKFSSENMECGKKDIFFISTDGTTKYAISVMFFSKIFMQADAETMFATINANPAGNYVLGEDITFSTVISKAGGYFGVQADRVPTQHNCEVYNEFTGTFDGRGYGLYNLKIQQTNAGNSGVCVFGVVSGTIKNMYVELIDVTTVETNSGPRGFTWKIVDDGRVTNIFLDWTVAHYSLVNSKNYYVCGGITTMLATAYGATNNIVKMYYGVDVTDSDATIGAIAGQATFTSSAQYTSGLAVNYVISQGTVVHQVGAAPTWGTKYNFANAVAFFDEVTELSTDDGWSDYWTIEDGKLYMSGVEVLNKIAPEEVTVTFNSNGGSEVAAQTVEVNTAVEKPENPTKDGYKFDGWYLDEKKFNFDTAITENITLVAKWIETVRLTGDCVIELSAASGYDFKRLGIESEIEYIGFDAEEAEKIAYDGYVFTAENIVAGERDMYIYTADVIYVVNTIFATEVFNQADAETMFATINAKPAGYYVLGEDITFSTVIAKAGTGFGAQSGKVPSQHNCEVYNEFTGTFDGRGYGLFNLQIKQTNAGNSGVCVFGVVTGTICNMYVELIDVTDVAANNGPRGLTHRIEGTGKVHNVFLDWTVAKYTLGNSANYYPCGGITTMLNVENGAVNNIVRMTYGADVTNVDATIGAIAGQTSLNSSTQYGVNYVISSGTVVKQVGNKAWYANRNFADNATFLEEVTELSANAGWSEYWNFTEGKLYFGDQVVVS